MSSGRGFRCLAILLVGITTAACGDDDDHGDDIVADADVTPDTTPEPDAPPVCVPANQPPAGPTLIAPTVVKDVLPPALELAASPFSDPDGDAAASTDFEIWTTTGGILVTRVWHAEIPGADGTAALADGAFDPGFSSLSDWSFYAARTRYRDNRAGGCEQASAWSDPVIFRTDDGSATLFDESVIRDIYIDIPPASWDAINAEAIPPGCVPYDRNYYSGSVTFEGVTYDDVGIKVKGGCGSARTLDAKAGLKINLDWDDPAVPGCPAGNRRIYGESHLTLNNQVQDYSAAHERMGYRLYRTLGVIVPRAAPIRVHINGQLYGLYLHQETIDRRFLAHRFDNAHGMLYEGTYYCDVLPANVPPNGDDSFCLQRSFSPDACSSQPADGDVEDYGPLRSFADQIAALPEGGFYPEVEAFFDYDTFLWQWAAESVMAHWDAYAFYITNNYRVYHDPQTGIWHMIPTGIDQVFHTDQDPFDVYGVLAWRCRQEPDCEAEFAARVHTLLMMYPAMDFGAQAQAIFEQVKDDVLADPKKDYLYQDFLNEHATLQQWIIDRPALVEQYLVNRGY